MQSLDEVKDEAELTKKVRQKRRIRGVLIVVNALLLCYTGYLVVDSIVDAVKKNNVKTQGELITLLNKSEATSKKIYDSLVNKDNRAEIADVATYGRYLLTSSSRVNHTSFNYSKDVYLCSLVDITNDGDGAIINKLSNVNEKLDEQIDLFSLLSGDYILYEGNPELKKAYHYTGEKYYSETVYSFPTVDGKRNKITIKGVSSSPALVISVTTQEAALPANYYDIVVINNSDTKVNWFEKTNLKIKEVKTIEEAYKLKSSYAINVVEESADIISSNYVTYGENHPSMISGGAYDGLDTDNAIRELGGYVFNAGYGIQGDDDISKASVAIKNVYSSSHIGKYTLSVGKNVENPLSSIKAIFNF